MALERLLHWHRPIPLDKISTHAPRVGSDRSEDEHTVELVDFNPRSPCGERQGHNPICDHEERFQSTLPVWGATFDSYAQMQSFAFQSTLPVWGATPSVGEVEFYAKISIHAPRVGSD